MYPRAWNRVRVCHPGILCEQLEERIVLDAAVAPVEQVQTLEDSEPYQQSSDGSDTTDATCDHADTAADIPDTLTSVFESDLNVVLISKALDDIEALSQSAPDDSEIVYFDAENDGVASINTVLQGLTDSGAKKIGSLTILSHGSEGVLSLGADNISLFNVSDYKPVFEQIGSLLTDDAQIQIYGCSVAADFFGQFMVDRIALYTGADVFASDDSTGGEQGDWYLEYASDPSVAMEGQLDLDVLATVDSELDAPYPAYENNWAIAMGKKLYYVDDDGVHGKELWRSDGTAEGTYMLKDINPGSKGSDPNQIVVLNGTLIFVATDGNSAGEHGVELWRSDGTEQGTQLIKDINDQAQQGSDPDELTVVDGVLFFKADGGKGSGVELWKSDGTDAGTVMIKDINDGSASSEPTEFTAVGSTLFFRADGGKGSGVELWKSDGTDAGTVMVKDINDGSASSEPTEFTDVGGILFFRADGGKGSGVELWKSDGTETGTVMVKDINKDLGASDSNPTELKNIDGVLYFSADGGKDLGVEPWKSDGTEAGTVLVKDINDGKGSSDPAEFTLMNGEVYFSADDGIAGRELWKTDLSTGTTTLVKDINPGSDSSAPRALYNYDGVLLFAADDGVHGYEPWKSDGTADGTVILDDINPNGSSFPINHARVNPLFFLADDGKGYELWKSDGTTSGTVKVSDVREPQSVASQGTVGTNSGSETAAPILPPSIAAALKSAPLFSSPTSQTAGSHAGLPSGADVEPTKHDSDNPFQWSRHSKNGSVDTHTETQTHSGADKENGSGAPIPNHFVPGKTKVIVLSAGNYSVKTDSMVLEISSSTWLPAIVHWYLVAIGEGRYRSGVLPPDHESMIWDFLDYVNRRKSEGQAPLGKMELMLAWQWAEWRKLVVKDRGAADVLPWSYFQGLSKALEVFYQKRGPESGYAEAMNALRYNAGSLSIIPLTLPSEQEAKQVQELMLNRVR